ncbi:MAG: hypothetical protein AB7D36_09050 [Oscillospiraceae bacterium]
MNKFEQLTADLRAAHDEALEKYGSSEDGGTRNFDAPTLYLLRWHHAEVEAAISAAGLTGRFWRFAGEWIIGPGGSGQGNRRTRVAEAMRDALRKKGYETGMYYQMD